MIENLAKALVAFQAEAPHIELDSTNPHFKSRFASLAGVMKAVRPVLTKHGLVIVQQPTVTAIGADAIDQPALKTTLLHESGDALTETMLLSVEKPGPQAQGAALTYARRYAVLAILGLVGDEDDDAESAETKPVEKPKATAGLNPNDVATPEKLKEAYSYATSAGFDFWSVADEIYGTAVGEGAITNAEAKAVCQEIAKQKKAK